MGIEYVVKSQNVKLDQPPENFLGRINQNIRIDEEGRTDSFIWNAKLFGFFAISTATARFGERMSPA